MGGITHGYRCIPEAEAHNIIKPRTDQINSLNILKVAELGNHLRKAKDAIVVLFTATPIVDDPAKDTRAIMSIVAGGRPLRSEDPIPEGYISWYMDRPRGQFARTEPASIESMPVPTFVVLKGKVLERYLLERFGVKKPAGKGFAFGPKKQKGKRKRWSPFALAPDDADDMDDVDDDEDDGRTWAVMKPNNSGNHPCITPDQHKACKSTIAQYEHLGFYVNLPPISYDPKNRKDVERWGREHTELTSKVAAIAESVRDNQVKTCIIMHRENGYEALQRVLEYYQIPYVGGEAACQRHLAPPPRAMQIPTAGDVQRVKAENKRIEDEFNALDNVRGKNIRVVLLTAEQHSEGVSLFNVRRLILADLSPGNTRPRWTLVQQRMGRVLRMCRHTALPPEERKVAIDVFVVCHNLTDLGFPKTLDQEKYDIVCAESETIRLAMKELRDVSVDATWYQQLDKKS